MIDIVLDLGVAYGVEIAESKVFELALDLLDTESVRKRRIDVHRLKRYRALFFIGLCRKGTHIVKSVGKLDEDNSDIL